MTLTKDNVWSLIDAQLILRKYYGYDSISIQHILKGKLGDLYDNLDSFEKCKEIYMHHFDNISFIESECKWCGKTIKDITLEEIKKK